MRYLVIAPPGDLCAQRVADTLRSDGAHEVLVTCEPLAGCGTFNWRLDARHSCWSLSFEGLAERFSAHSLHGVYVRAYLGPPGRDDWVAEEEWAYISAEAQAALIGWLAAVECRVLNRPTAATWFRPRRPYPEWQMLLNQCGLPALGTLVTNNLEAARDFARRCGNALTYTPMTSATRYALQDDEAWERIARLIRVLPVCLIEQGGEVARGSAWVIGREVVWDRPLMEQSSRRRFEKGALALARQLGFDSFEIHYSRGREGWCCSGVDLLPRLETYEREPQQRIVQSLRALLECPT